ncbi:uncharacterized protein [Ptychodera flava]|uniref:uncharacterized protein n=1 Tax=Ptychodera flava TaxID=63121 RepID=UPI00396A6ECF
MAFKDGVVLKSMACVICVAVVLYGFQYLLLRRHIRNVIKVPQSMTRHGYENLPAYSKEQDTAITHASGKSTCDSTQYRKLLTIRDRATVMESAISRAMEELHITKLMMKTALAHKTSFARLKASLKDVLLTGRSLNVGLVGGSISVGTVIYGEQYLFANRSLRLLEDVLGSPIVFQNGAVGATTTLYHILCMDNHLDLQILDMILWESAVNDFYGFLGPELQEEFTRLVMKLPNQPQLVYVNFQFGKHVLEKNCVNNEQCCSNPLSKYYDVPSINMPDAVCDLIRSNRADDLVGPDNCHPSRKAHAMMSIFLIQLLKDAIYEAIHDSLKTVLADCDFDLRKLQSPNIQSRKLPKPLFDEIRIIHPQCRSTARSQSGNINELVPSYRGNWRLSQAKRTKGRLDTKAFWLSQPNSIIRFRFDVKPHKNLTSNLIVMTMGDQTNGLAFLTLDKDSMYCINSHHKHNLWQFHFVKSGLPPGNHLLTVLSRDKPVRFAAIITTYDDQTQYNLPKYKPVYLKFVLERKVVKSPQECWETEW